MIAPALARPAAPRLETVPLGPPEPPSLPSDVFGEGWLRDIVDAVAAATETPRELPAAFALAALATACQGRFVIKPEPGYREPLCLWVLAALESGNRKTAVLQAMTRPLVEWEREQGETIRPEIIRVESERKTLEARVQSKRTAAARIKEPAEFSEAMREVAALEAELPVVPTAPRLWTQDATPERLAALLAEQDERMAVLSDEGGVFDIIGGRYSNGIPNLDVYLQAHAGAPVRVDRQGRPPVFLQSPALSMGLSPQPHVIRALADQAAFRGRGLLARFLYLLPPSPLGKRTLQTKPAPDWVVMAYAANLRRLLETPPSIGDDGRPRPHALHLNREAHSEWKAFARRVESGLADGGQFEHVRDWAGKLPGAAARLAGLLHCSEHTLDDPALHEVSGETMSRALELAALFSCHALMVFDLIGADESLQAARTVWRWVERTRADTFTARECFTALRGTFHRMNRLEPALDVLVERGYLRRVRDTERGQGRPRRMYQVNPSIVERWS